MAINTQQTQRVFLYAGLELADTDPSAPVQKVLQHWAAVYPELTTAAIEGPEVRGERLSYTFVRAVRDKGASGCEFRTISERIAAARCGDLSALDRNAVPIPKQSANDLAGMKALMQLMKESWQESGSEQQRRRLALRVAGSMPMLP